MVDDLQKDYTNPVDMTAKVNFMWWPDIGIYAVLCFIFLVTGHWVVLLLHLPLLAYHIYLVYTNRHLTDPTTILQGDNIAERKRISFIKLGWAILSFALYMYMLIAAAIEDAQSRQVITTNEMN